MTDIDDSVLKKRLVLGKPESRKLQHSQERSNSGAPGRCISLPRAYIYIHIYNVPQASYTCQRGPLRVARLYCEGNARAQVCGASDGDRAAPLFLWQYT